MTPAVVGFDEFARQRPSRPRPVSLRRGSPPPARRLVAVLAAVAVIATVMVAVVVEGAPGRAPASSVDSAAGRAYAELPVSFEANLGQSDPTVRYLARTGAYTAFLTDDEAV
jgi:anti-sigma factor RsiW